MNCNAVIEYVDAVLVCICNCLHVLECMNGAENAERKRDWKGEYDIYQR